MTKMNARIHNRTGETPADHWYQIEVSGEHPAVGNRIQVIDPEALQAILNRFQEEAKNPDFTGLLVDAVDAVVSIPEDEIVPASPLLAGLGGAWVEGFIVQGERRYWLHLSMDRITGKVIDSQLNPVFE